ncbi:MAG: hypothetical protein DCC68_10420 [Planctomycetota bacterium]|nr:MAG: hypothetical protein DCC68_10420 [Planctomycetota bacterium]
MIMEGAAGGGTDERAARRIFLDNGGELPKMSVIRLEGSLVTEGGLRNTRHSRDRFPGTHPVIGE